MKKLLLACALSVLMINVYAQQSNAPDTTKVQKDSVEIPKKYQNIHKRNPVLAGALSLFIPGLGQVYNKQVGKGAILYGTFAASFGAAEIYYSKNKMHPHDEVTGALLVPFFAAYVYSLIDAPITASRLNKKYHLGKKKKEGLTSFNLSPTVIYTAQNKCATGLSLVLR